MNGWNYQRKFRVTLGLSIVVLCTILVIRDIYQVLRAVSVAGALMLFYSLDRYFDLRFTKKHYAYIFIIVVLNILFSPLFFVFNEYDKVIHFFIPMLACSLVLFMVSRHTLDMKWKLTFSFFITIGILAIHEVGEYLLDFFLHDYLMLQGVYVENVHLHTFSLIVSKFDDTMVDLIFGTTGTALYIMFVYFYSKMHSVK
ncbi:hypothetical protein KW805_00645 [Candidatus Pacearchaeota archaeon]|nr:hypothetical protein [Candidatus Pacearchaeota archaeon]